MRLRSLLFVPGDRPERFAKAAASGADAIILDLEDSVALSRKADARAAIADYLAGERPVTAIVRVNPLDSGMTEFDLAAILTAAPDMVMLPKAESVGQLQDLRAMLRDLSIVVPERLSAASIRGTGAARGSGEKVPSAKRFGVLPGVFTGATPGPSHRGTRPRDCAARHACRWRARRGGRTTR